MLYSAVFPSDYVCVQIPGALTAEMESEKKAKDAKRKKIQKESRKERLKVHFLHCSALKALWNDIFHILFLPFHYL